MALDVYFTEKASPDLMSVPLKGESLQAFLEAMEILPETFDPSAGELGEIIYSHTQRVCREIIQKTQGAKQHGVDIDDIKHILQKVAHQSSNDLMPLFEEKLAAHVQMIDGVASYTQGDNPERYQQMFSTSIIAPEILSIFSACLALQEEKGNTLIYLAVQNRAAILEKLQTRREEAGDEFMCTYLTPLCGMVDFGNYRLQAIEEQYPHEVPAWLSLIKEIARGSRHSKERGRSDDALIEGAIAIQLKVDPDTAAGRNQIQNIKAVYNKRFSGPDHSSPSR